MTLGKKRKQLKKGFTLVELLTAMAITLVIVTMMVTITSVALTAWNKGRNEVRASRQAKALLDAMGKDFESMVTRSGNEFEWLRVVSMTPDAEDLEVPNASRMIFFTSATDRYDGNLGGADDQGGDISTVIYNLEFKDPVRGDRETKRFNTFAFYRQLLDPRETFDDMLASRDLESSYQTYQGRTGNSEHFICENIFELSATFLIEYEDSGGTMRQVRVPVMTQPGGDAVGSFSIRGTGIEGDNSDAKDYANGRILSVDLSISVITDHGLGVLKAAGDKLADRETFLANHTYRYSKTVNLPQP